MRVVAILLGTVLAWAMATGLVAMASLGQASAAYLLGGPAVLAGLVAALAWWATAEPAEPTEGHDGLDGSRGVPWWSRASDWLGNRLAIFTLAAPLPLAAVGLLPLSAPVETGAAIAVVVTVAVVSHRWARCLSLDDVASAVARPTGETGA